MVAIQSTRRLVLIAMLVVLTAAASFAQEKNAEAARLDVLIAELRAVSKESWEQRVAAMQKDVATRQQQAADLRKQAEQLVARAAQLDAEAKARAAEIAQLAELRKLLGGMTFAAPKPPPSTPPESSKPPEAKPEAPPKPAPKPDGKPAPEPSKAPAPAAAAAAAAPMPAGEAAMADDAAPAAATEQLLTYEDHLSPLFEEHCTVCHDTFDAEGGLDLSTYSGAIRGGGSGKTLKPGNPEASRLYLLVSHREKPTMPPREPRIAGEKIEAIRQWIAQGAPENAAQAQKLAAERQAQAWLAAQRAAASSGDGATLPEILPDHVPALDLNLPARPPVLRAVAVSPCAPVLAVPGFEQVLLLHADSLVQLAVLPFDLGHVTALAFSGDGSSLLAAGGVPGQRGGAVLYDVQSGAERGRFTQQRDQVLAAAPSPDGSLVAVGDNRRRRVEVFAVEAPDQPLYQVAHDDWVTALTFSADGELLASADRKGAIHVTEARTGRDAHTLRGHEGAVLALAFRPDAEQLVSGGADGRTMGWRMKDGERAWNEGHHGGAVHGVAFAGVGRLLSVGADGYIVAAKADGKRAGRERVAEDWLYGVALSADGSKAVTVDWTATVTAIDAKTLDVAGRAAPFVIEP